MKTDLKYMHTEISVLKQQIIDLVLLKFGKVLKVDIIDEHLEKKTFGDDLVNELMEALLRKMVHDLRLSLADVKSLYKNELILWEKKLENAEIEYTEALRDNTARLDLLGLLKKEKLELTSQIANQDKTREMVDKRKGNAADIDGELHDLKQILKKQEKQIEAMRNEIKLLKSKSRFPSTIKVDEVKVDAVKKEAFDDIEHAREYLYPELVGEGDISDIQLPSIGVQGTKEERKEEVVKSVMKNILDTLDVKLDEVSLQNFIRETIIPLIDYASVQEIVKEIVSKVGVKPAKLQLEYIKSSAELLKVSSIDLVDSEAEIVKKPPSKPTPAVSAMTSSEIKLYVGMIMDNILKDMMSQTEEFKYHISLCNIMMRSVEEIPIEVLKRVEAAETISEKLSSCSCFSRDSIDKVKLAEVIQVWEECLCGSKDSIDKVQLAEVEIDWDDEHAPVRRMVDELLNRVFATGLDIVTFRK